MVYLPPTTTNKSLITAYELSLESGTFGHLAGDTWQQFSAGCSTSVWLQTLAGLDENMAPDSPDALVCQLCPFCPTTFQSQSYRKSCIPVGKRTDGCTTPTLGCSLNPVVKNCGLTQRRAQGKDLQPRWFPVIVLIQFILKILWLAQWDYMILSYTVIYVNVCAAFMHRLGSTKNSTRLGANAPKGHRVLKEWGMSRGMPGMRLVWIMNPTAIG